jgi:hypothetical protein
MTCASGVERDVAGLDADAVAVDLAEVAEFLVGERLDRGGVEDAGALRHALLDRVFGDEGFPGAGGRGDDQGFLVVDDADGLFLERIQGDAAIVHERSGGEAAKRLRTGGGVREKDPRGIAVL